MDVDDTQKKLFSLMLLAEEQQKNAQGTLDSLADEREKLLAAVEKFDHLIEEVIPTIKNATQAALNGELRNTLAEVSNTAQTALKDATNPVFDRFSRVIKTADDVESRLARVNTSFVRHWSLIAGGSALAIILAAVLVAWIATWWQREAVQSLLYQKAQLQPEVVRLQTEVTQLQLNAEKWRKKAPRHAKKH